MHLGKRDHYQTQSEEILFTFQKFKYFSDVQKSGINEWVTESANELVLIQISGNTGRLELFNELKCQILK